MAYSRKWLNLSPEEKKLKRIGYRKKYEDNHPERVIEQRLRYEQKHHEQIRITASTWQRKKGRQNKLKAIEYLGGHCADCKNEFPYYVYDFHHTDPTIKDFEISHIMGRKWENIVPELNKCVLLCANCHRIREYKADDL
jgi:NAD-dependent dihydropyrimidine dehydrogenase PreA subunit